MVERRGYGTRAALPPPERVEDHVDDLVAALDAAGIERAVVAGCSGGATIALAAALTAPERVVAAIAHEPAVGSLGPELMALIASVACRPAAWRSCGRSPGPTTWSRLTPDERAELEAVRARSSPPTRAPTSPGSRRWTASPRRRRSSARVGRRSAPMRHAIAAVVQERIGAQVVVIEDCGHLVQLDAPAAFAAVISAAGAVAGTVGATSSTI